MTARRVSFWFGGSFPAWTSLAMWTMAGMVAVSPGGRAGDLVLGIAVDGLVVLGLLNLVRMNRLTVAGDRVLVRRSLLRAPEIIPRGVFRRVTLTLEGGRNKSYVVRVYTTRLVVHDDSWYLPARWVRPRAERIARALGCEFADASEQSMSEVEAARLGVYGHGRAVIRKAEDLDRSVAELLRRGSRRPAPGPMPPGLRCAATLRRIAITLPPPGLDLFLLIPVAGILLVVFFLWDTRSPATALSTGAGLTAATLAWFLYQPQTVSVTRRSLRWTGLPFTRAIPLARLEEFDLDPATRILARSDATSLHLADGARHTTAQRRWIHARLEAAIAELADDGSAT